MENRAVILGPALHQDPEDFYYCCCTISRESLSSMGLCQHNGRVFHSLSLSLERAPVTNFRLPLRALLSGWHDGTTNKCINNLHCPGTYGMDP